MIDEQGRRFVPGKWVAAARLSKGINQGGLARILDAAQNTVSRRELGGIKVTYETWLATLHALDLPKDWEPTVEQLVQVETKKAK